MSAGAASLARPPRRRASRLCVALLLAVAGRGLEAQAPGAPRPGPPALEGRLDLLAGRLTTAHAGAGITWPLGRYVRIGAVAAGGVTRGVPGGVNGDAVASARADLVARFVVEPAAGERWRYYGGTGGGVLVARGLRGQARVHVLVGAELPPIGRLRPGVEFGVGGGTRLGLVLRRTRGGG